MVESRPQTVRVLVEDDATKEVKWYASFGVDSGGLNHVIANRNDHPGIIVTISTHYADNVFQTYNANVVMIDLAIELYRAYHAGQEQRQFLKWNELAVESQEQWINVARRMSTLAPLHHSSPQTAEESPPVTEDDFGGDTRCDITTDFNRVR